MKRKLGLTGLLLAASTPAFAAGGFTWSDLFLSWLKGPLISVGLDPLPLLDMIWVCLLLLAVAYIGGKPFRKTEMLEPQGKASMSHLMEIIVGGILNFLSGIIRHGKGPRPVLPLLGTDDR